MMYVLNGEHAASHILLLKGRPLSRRSSHLNRGEWQIGFDITLHILIKAGILIKVSDMWYRVIYRNFSILPLEAV